MRVPSDHLKKLFSDENADKEMPLAGCIKSIFMLISLNPVLMVPRGISAILCIRQIKLFVATIKNQEVSKKLCLRQHFRMMMCTYIATITAFIVVNVNDFKPACLLWLAPTTILIPLIIYLTKKYAGYSFK